MLKAADMKAGDQLSFVAADLLADQGGSEAVAGCKYVLHGASPFPTTMPKNEQEIIAPAKEGTLRVLRAARNAGVKRVVLTSSFAAVGYGHAPTTAIFTEADWTNLKASGLSAYVKSKTLAKQVAWELIRPQGNELELSVINPVGIFEPLLGAKTIDLEAFMNRHYRFNVSLARFGYLTGRSLSAFKRNFTRIFGLAPGRWRLARRLEEAYFLLTKTDRSVSDVCFAVGFEDLSHFSFSFKARYQVAPTQLRKVLMKDTK